MKKLTFVMVLAMVLLVGVAAIGPNTAIFKAILVQNDAAIGQDLAVGNNLTVAGAQDVTGYVSYGPLDLRPIGNPSNGKIIMMGVTSAKAQSATVVPTVQGIATVTAFGCAPDDAAFSGVEERDLDGAGAGVDAGEKRFVHVGFVAGC